MRRPSRRFTSRACESACGVAAVFQLRDAIEENCSGTRFACLSGAEGALRLRVSTGLNGGAGSAAMRLLFIGNSYTARNDLPGRMQRLALALNRPITVRLISAGGASLKRHWNAAGTIDTVNEGWDGCVLQEQSTLPIRSPARYFESVRLFDQAVRASGGRTVLYLPWHRQGQAAAWPSLSGAVLSIAREIGATVVPVGIAWRIALARDPQLPLYAPDGSHPTALGTTLAALTFAIALLGDLTEAATESLAVPPSLVPQLIDAANQAVERVEAQPEPA